MSCVLSRVQLQRVPRLVVLPGNKKTDALAKSETGQSQPMGLVTLNSACFRITTTVIRFRKEVQRNVSIGERWKGLAMTSLRRDLPHGTIRVIAEFHLVTGYDYLQTHLRRIGLRESDQCLLLSDGRMDRDHLLTFTSPKSSNTNL